MPSKETETQAELKPWRYEIQHGPDGETHYAWVYDGDNHMVCTARTHYARAITDAMNRRASVRPQGHD